MATTKKAIAVSYKVTNLQPNTNVKPLQAEVSSQTIDGATKVATSLMQALKFAVNSLFNALQGNSQFPTGSKIEFGFGDVWTTLPETTARLFKGTEVTFNVKYDEIVEAIFGGFAMKDTTLGEAYVRATDKGEVFKGSKVTTKIVASQIQARTKYLASERKFMTEDAEASIHGADLARFKARQLQRAKSQKELKEAVQKLLGNK